MAARYGYSRRTSGYREHWYTFVNWPGVAIAIGSFLAFVALGWFVVVSMQEQERWEDWCHAQGAHVDRTSEIVFIGRDPSTNYTYYCLTSDGKILDIKE